MIGQDDIPNDPLHPSITTKKLLKCAMLAALGKHVFAIFDMRILVRESRHLKLVHSEDSMHPTKLLRAFA